MHLAVAEISFPALLTAGDPRGFASRDEAQATAATALGYELI